jgi:hypothetical protein
MVFFQDTNGGCDTSTSNRLRLNYAPLQQLALDLANNTVADYNWITPDQYNDQHSTLANNYGHFTGDTASIAQGDNFLALIVPLIMSSDAYQDHGVIVLWWDESEGGDDPSRTLPFIIISQDYAPCRKFLTSTLRAIHGWAPLQLQPICRICSDRARSSSRRFT